MSTSANREEICRKYDNIEDMHMWKASSSNGGDMNFDHTRLNIDNGEAPKSMILGDEEET